MIHSLSYAELEKVKAIKPSVQCGYIMSLALGNYQSLTAADFFTVETTSINSDSVETVHASGKKVYAWTIDEDEDIDKVVDAGVDGVITNYVSKVKAKLLEKDNLFAETYKSFLK
jgi:glycerophosphoryl diester phosphodiesterase